MNDTHRIRLTHLLAIVAAVLLLVLAGCGGDDDNGDGNGDGGDEAAETQDNQDNQDTETTPPADDQGDTGGGDAEAAEQTVRDYIDGIVSGDGGKVCDQFTSAGREELDEIGGCEELFDGLLTALSDEQKDEIRQADPEVEVNGDRATATVPSIEGDGEETINLSKEGGEWKISDIESEAGEGP
jgi:hypothetical protein